MCNRTTEEAPTYEQTRRVRLFLDQIQNHARIALSLLQAKNPSPIRLAAEIADIKKIAARAEREIGERLQYGEGLEIPEPSEQKGEELFND